MLGEGRRSGGLQRRAWSVPVRGTDTVARRGSRFTEKARPESGYLCYFDVQTTKPNQASCVPLDVEHTAASG